MDELKHIIDSFLGRTQEGPPIGKDRTSRFLASRLRGYSLDSQDLVEDIISETRLKVLRRIDSSEFTSLGQWFVYVAKAAERLAIDYLKRHGREDSVEDFDDVPEDRFSLISAIAEISDSRDALYQAADECWLQLQPSLSKAERDRRFTAAELFFDGSSFEEISQTLSATGQITREEFNSWLNEASCVLRLAYSVVYQDNDSLTGIILDPHKPLTPSQLDDLTALSRKHCEGEAVVGFDWPEVKVILWHYRNGLADRKIMQMCPQVDQATIDCALRKAQTRLPFKADTERFLLNVMRRRVSTTSLKKPGLCRRVAFQYFVFDELPQKQIMERMAPAAKSLSVKFTDGMLNAGVSNGRYFLELAEYVRGRKRHAT